MDPSDAECQGFGQLSDLTTWAGLPGDAADQATSAGSFLHHLGFTATAHWRGLAAISETDFSTLLAAWKIPQTGSAAIAPSAGQLAQAGLVGRAARIAGGVQKTTKQLQTESEAQLAHDRAVALAQAKAPAQAASSSATASPAKVRTVPMSDVADLARKDEPTPLAQSEVDKFYKKYNDLMHCDPPWDEEPTVDQITAVYTLLEDKVPPYVDLALFGPHGHRIQRNLKLTGMHFSPEGELVRVELKGPPSVSHWKLCMKVLSTVLIGLGALSPPTIASYIDKISQYTIRYGDQCWAIIYQCEVRFRREFVERIRRREALKYAEAQQAGNSYPYDPNRPWERVYWVGVEESVSWWHQHLEEPCQCVCARVRVAGSFVDGDAMVGSAVAHIPTMGAMPHSLAALTNEAHARTSADKESRTRPPPRPPPSYEKPPKRPAKERVHNVGPDGALTTNRSGHPLCRGFQDGSCTHGSNGICGRDGRMRHQCANCLSIDHGQNHPSPCTRPRANPPKAPGNAGKSGGKWGKGGKGKGGKY